MGVGGNFWDLLKPYVHHEGFDFLRNKRVAIDLSFWIVQHETAIRANARNPHLRLTFFRTINLFSKFGTFPVFVVDGVPSAMKSQARIARFYRNLDVNQLDFPVVEEGVSVERNSAFTRCVQECVELLTLLGMPVLKAKGEAEALCAQLNREGVVDACITADSDAFLFGAKRVIKCFRPNSKEPFECYHMSDIEAGLGLERKHLIAIALLVGTDHDLNGVQGIGIDTALRFVRSFHEDEIMDRLREMGKGNSPNLLGNIKSVGDTRPSLDVSSPKIKSPHCSHCGHPGSKRAHLKFACEYCFSSASEGCVTKPVGFKCDCSSCDMHKKNKEQKKLEIWHMNVCKKIAMEQNFPNDEIIKMYLSTDNTKVTASDVQCMSWESPRTEMLIDFLSYHQHWDPSYIRQRLLPLLCTHYLRKFALNPTANDLLHGQYEFHSIHRIKVRFGHQFYVVNWKKATPSVGNVAYSVAPDESDHQQKEDLSSQLNDSLDLMDEIDPPLIRVDDGCFFLLTDENMELVQAAFPEKVDRFLQEKELKEAKAKRKRFDGHCDNSESAGSSSVQLSITEFYRSSKLLHKEKRGEQLADNSPERNASKESTKSSSPQHLSKSVRRRLLFG